MNGSPITDLEALYSGEPQRDTSETIAEAIRPTLDVFVVKAEPACRKVAETIYETLLDTVQDYLRENAEWNIGAEIDRCRKIEHDNTWLRGRNAELERALESLNCSDILGVAESCASGTGRWEFVNERITRARAVIAKVQS